MNESNYDVKKISENLIKKFDNITKGSLNISEISIEWILGDIKIYFYHEDEDENYLACVMSKQRSWEEVTHLNLTNCEIDELIIELNSPSKVVCIEEYLAGLCVSFSVIDKDKRKKESKHRYYSD